MTFCLLSLLVILPLHPVGALAMTLCLLSLLAFLPLLPRRFCLLIFPHLLLPRRFSRLISPLAFSLLGTQLLQRLRHPVAHGGGAAVDTFTLNVTIPPNVKATVHVPSEHAAHVREPGGGGRCQVGGCAPHSCTSTALEAGWRIARRGGGHSSVALELGSGTRGWKRVAWQEPHERGHARKSPRRRHCSAALRPRTKNWLPVSSPNPEHAPRTRR